ncbi:hypothetical protein F8A87_09775 [Betaproteobacteria bacterium SCN2]|jgi:hypothetical protein|nr:hypothetical protein F8A87_09775 [Betaproteobacteria bacterium SCN2]
MGKLTNLKEWLTVSDAAKHLSIVFGEEVIEADVLRLALDGRFRLSVYFVNYAKARCGRVVPWEETNWMLFPKLNYLSGARDEEKVRYGLDVRPCPLKLEALFKELPPDEFEKFTPLLLSLNIDNERFLTLSDNVTTLQGVWDLPMIGNEQLDIEHEYQNLTGGPAVTLQGLDGAFVEGPDGQICQLQEDFDENKYQPGSSAQMEELERHIANNGIEGAEAESLLSRHKEERKKFLEERRTKSAKEKYYPAGGLPEDAVLVVRTEALREFEESVNGAPKGLEKPLTTTERNTLLTIIAAICDYSAIKVEERGAASQIARLTEEIGAPVSDDTVRRALAKIPDALESRMK